LKGKCQKAVTPELLIKRGSYLGIDSGIPIKKPGVMPEIAGKLYRCPEQALPRSIFILLKYLRVDPVQ
jgi:hypothetical protein